MRWITPEKPYRFYKLNFLTQDESERLQILHNVLNRVFDGRLIFPPLTRLRRILECGYGTGGWACEVAEQNPRCEVSSHSLFLHFIAPNEKNRTYVPVRNFSRTRVARSCHEETNSIVVNVDEFTRCASLNRTRRIELARSDSKTIWDREAMTIKEAALWSGK